MTFKSVQFTLAADVADAGTFTVAYPAGMNSGDFSGATGHYMMINGIKYRQPADIAISFGATGATSATITNRSGGTLLAGSKGVFQFEQFGKAVGIALDTPGLVDYLTKRTTEPTVLTINLGAPIALDADGVCESQNRTGAGVLLINGALSNGELATSVATFDVPRNVIADSGGADTAVLTITGTDEYGQVMVENITLNGTTAVAGVKAFKTITGVSSDGTVTNGMFLGTGDVLGLPIALTKGAANILKEFQDDAAATAGTTVAALTKNTESTATTADVRGTYDPNAACDGVKAFTLVVAVGHPSIGSPQFAG